MNMLSSPPPSPLLLLLLLVLLLVPVVADGVCAAGTANGMLDITYLAFA
jgi:hypothetical protein